MGNWGNIDRARAKLAIRKWSLRGVWALVVFVVATLAGQFLVAYGEEQGWFQRPSEKVSAVTGALMGVLSSSWFMILCGLIIGFAAGVRLDLFLKPRDEPSSPPEEPETTMPSTIGEEAPTPVYDELAPPTPPVAQLAPSADIIQKADASIATINKGLKDWREWAERIAREVRAGKDTLFLTHGIGILVENMRAGISGYDIEWPTEKPNPEYIDTHGMDNDGGRERYIRFLSEYRENEHQAKIVIAKLEEIRKQAMDRLDAADAAAAESIKNMLRKGHE